MLLAALPLLHRTYLLPSHGAETSREVCTAPFAGDSWLNPWLCQLCGPSHRDVLVAVTSFAASYAVARAFLWHLAAAQRAFRVRLLYCKYACCADGTKQPCLLSRSHTRVTVHMCRYFAALTSSSRRARKLDLPYFHLLKPENIKLWLSLRAAVQRRGNKRATEAVVTVSFAVALALVRCECKSAAWGM